MCDAPRLRMRVCDCNGLLQREAQPPTATWRIKSSPGGTTENSPAIYRGVGAPHETTFQPREGRKNTSELPDHLLSFPADLSGLCQQCEFTMHRLSRGQVASKSDSRPEKPSTDWFHPVGLWPKPLCGFASLRLCVKTACRNCVSRAPTGLDAKTQAPHPFPSVKSVVKFFFQFFPIPSLALSSASATMARLCQIAILRWSCGSMLLC